MSEPAPLPEMSRPVLIHRLPETGLSLKIQAEPAECEALAKRLQLVALRSLEANLTVERHGGPDIYAVRGEIEARLVQTCVVSLEPFESVTWAPFERLFGSDAPQVEEAEITIDPELLDLEPLTGDHLDLGELVVEELAVNLDPYPRAPGQEGSPAENSTDASESGPFAALRSLRRNQEDGR